jgi:hypothetical protein
VTEKTARARANPEQLWPQLSADLLDYIRRNVDQSARQVIQATQESLGGWWYQVHYEAYD